MKYPVLRDMKYNGRHYPAGSVITRDAIEKGPSYKLGTLLRTRYIGEPGDARLEDMKVDELRDHARSLGLTGPLPRRKVDLIEAIEGAKHGS